MTNIAVSNNRITSMSVNAINKVKSLEHQLESYDQLELITDHVIHAGMYSRSLFMPAGSVMTGVIIKIPTILIVSGHATVWIDNQTIEITGYQVFAASANRKQAFAFHADTHLTMIFPTSSKTIEDAENEFTDEADALMSRHINCINNINITGE